MPRGGNLSGLSFVVFLLLLAVEGLLVGAFARLALPGKDPLSLLQTMAVGLAGSFIAGIAFYLVFGEAVAPGFLASLVFATGIMYVIRRGRGGGLLDPGGGAPEARRRDP